MSQYKIKIDKVFWGRSTGLQGGNPRGSHSQRNWLGEVCGPLPKTLTLFKTKICNPIPN